jgi:hypothetical protein
VDGFSFFLLFCATGVDAAPSFAPNVSEVLLFKRPPPTIKVDVPNDLCLKASSPVFPDPGEACTCEARSPQSKVTRVVSKKIFGGRNHLQKEVDRWLTEVTAAEADRVPSSSSRPSLTVSPPQSSALFLSSFLFKAVLTNHIHSPMHDSCLSDILALTVVVRSF